MSQYSKEHQNIEWKESWHNDYFKWICGFANAQGGILFIGIDDKGNTKHLDNAKKLMEDLPNQVRDLLGLMVDVNLHTTNGDDYLEIVVEPYPFPISLRGKYYYRSGSTLQELKGAALAKFLLQRQGKKWDGVPIPNVTAEDLKNDTFEFFRDIGIEVNDVIAEFNAHVTALNDVYGTRHGAQVYSFSCGPALNVENVTFQRFFKKAPGTRPICARQYPRMDDVAQCGAIGGAAQVIINVCRYAVRIKFVAHFEKQFHQFLGREKIKQHEHVGLLGEFIVVGRISFRLKYAIQPVYVTVFGAVTFPVKFFQVAVTFKLTDDVSVMEGHIHSGNDFLPVFKSGGIKGNP